MAFNSHTSVTTERVQRELNMHNNTSASYYESSFIELSEGKKNFMDLRSCKEVNYFDQCLKNLFQNLNGTEKSAPISQFALTLLLDIFQNCLEPYANHALNLEYIKYMIAENHYNDLLTCQENNTNPTINDITEILTFLKDIRRYDIHRLIMENGYLFWTPPQKQENNLPTLQYNIPSNSVSPQMNNIQHNNNSEEKPSQDKNCSCCIIL